MKTPTTTRAGLMASDDGDRGILWLMVGCTILMLVFLLFTWYSASLGTSRVTASGWEATKLVSLAVIIFGGVVGTAAGSHLRAPGDVGTFGSRRDLGHLAVTVGALLLVLYLFRALDPPRFYSVTDFAPTFNGLDDPSVQASVGVKAPLILSMLCAVGVVVAGVRLAFAQPEGFDPRYCLTILREIWRRR